ncbi:MAG TPA: ATP-grasp domain-containing protein [Acidimicrobiales bacterium]|nr:ATP-grasp domain-containing protein [Acidimicrobiales bacterium]
MARVLLILPTSTYRAPEFLAAAARLGVEVVTASEEAQALAAIMGDHFLRLPVDDPLAAAGVIEDFGRRVPLDAVLAVDDRGALAGALGAARLGLRHNPLDAVRATTDKSLLRAKLAAAGVNQPASLPLPGGAARPEALRRAGHELGYPMVLKPLSLAASRGVIRADDAGEAQAAVARIERILEECGLSGEALLAEAYVPGREVALEGLLAGGALETLCLFDKPDPLEGPFFEETIYVTPSRLAADEQARVSVLVAAGCRALGLTEGPVHAEVRLPEVGGALSPTLIEVAARTIGGRCAKALRFATGERLEELVLANALGGGCPADLAGAAGVMMLPIASSGRLVEVHGRRDALLVEGIVGLEIAIPRGGRVVALPEGDRYLGFLFAAGADPAHVEASLRAAHALLDVEIAAEEAFAAPRR